MENGSQNTMYRKQKLREEGKIEIPMSIDPARYFIGNIRWKDILSTAPFGLLSVIMIITMNKTGNLNTSTFLLSFLPPALVLTFFWVKHPDRKNISIITTVWWKIKYLNAKKLYEYSKEVKDDMSEDIRSQLGVFDIANDCIETLDNRLIKVIEVSSINLSGISERERNRVYSNYQTFLNNYDQSSFPIQIEQFSRPINLSDYLNWVRQNTDDQQNQYKRMFADSYIDKVNDIQKSKNMVSKARYVIVSVKVGSNKEKALEKINMKAEHLVSQISNMLSDKHKLRAAVMDNDALFQYIYACIDYENAQIKQSLNHDNVVNLPYSVGAKTYKDEVAATSDLDIDSLR